MITHVVMFKLRDASPDLDALERYRVHPDHEKVARYLVDASETRAAVDYER